MYSYYQLFLFYFVVNNRNYCEYISYCMLNSQCYHKYEYFYFLNKIDFSEVVLYDIVIIYLFV